MKGIYCFIDKKTDEVVYVGKDSNINVNRRCKAHKTMKEANYV